MKPLCGSLIIMPETISYKVYGIKKSHIVGYGHIIEKPNCLMNILFIFGLYSFRYICILLCEEHILRVLKRIIKSKS